MKMDYTIDDASYDKYNAARRPPNIPMKDSICVVEYILCLRLGVITIEDVITDWNCYIAKFGVPSVVREISDKSDLFYNTTRDFLIPIQEMIHSYPVYGRDFLNRVYADMGERVPLSIFEYGAPYDMCTISYSGYDKLYAFLKYEPFMLESEGDMMSEYTSQDMVQNKVCDPNGWYCEYLTVKDALTGRNRLDTPKRQDQFRMESCCNVSPTDVLSLIDTRHKHNGGIIIGPPNNDRKSRLIRRNFGINSMTERGFSHV